MMKKENPFDAFVVVGVNHWSAPVEIREAFSMNTTQKRALLADAYSRGIEQLIIVSTCNRTELFSNETDSDTLISLLVNHSSGLPKQFEQHGFETFGEDAVRHLFEVAVGLDAQILGDLQIINQVKESYEFSSEHSMVHSELHRLLHTVFRAHKRVRNETDLGVGASSVASAAVQFAQHRLGNLSHKEVVLVGTGKIGKVTCKNLVKLGVNRLTLVNRNFEKAMDLADRFDIHYAGLDQLSKVISKADLVIVATGAMKPVVCKEHLKYANPDQFKVLIDLSVPRNISPEVADVEGVELANMDHLETTMDHAYRTRKQSIPDANAIIRHELHVYKKWLCEQKIVPTITALTKKLHDIRTTEMERFKAHFEDESFDKIDLLTHRIVNKIAAHSIEFLREQNGEGEKMAKLIDAMFDLTTNEEKSPSTPA